MHKRSVHMRADLNSIHSSMYLIFSSKSASAPAVWEIKLVMLPMQ